MTTLDKLMHGDCATVKTVGGVGSAIYQRLMEMGLLEDVEIEVLAFAPFGDPLEIRLRDYRLSLRRTEAARVRVTLLP